jgi:hypothetical protein
VGGGGDANEKLFGRCRGWGDGEHSTLNSKPETRNPKPYNMNLNSLVQLDFSRFGKEGGECWRQW